MAVARLHIGTWFWGKKYPIDYVSRLDASVKRNLSLPYRWHVWTPPAEDMYLTDVKGCFCRLRLFDPAWQAEQEIELGDRIVCMDLDSIVTGAVDTLFDRDDPFSILQGANRHQFKFNGSIFSVVAGAYPEVWSGFSLQEARRIPFAEFPDDQQWMEAKIQLHPDAWQVGSASGIYAMGKPGWPAGEALPEDARLVVFPGWRDPAKFQHLGWVREHWRT